MLFLSGKYKLRSKLNASGMLSMDGEKVATSASHHNSSAMQAIIIVTHVILEHQGNAQLMQGTACPAFSEIMRNR